jgi:hypothetical protein
MEVCGVSEASGTGGYAQPGESFIRLLAGAYGRACRERVVEVTVDHILHESARHGGPRITSVGEDRGAADAAAPPDLDVQAALGDAARSGTPPFARKRFGEGRQTRPAWSPRVVAGVRRALLDAQALGVPYARATHLIAALLAALPVGQHPIGADDDMRRSDVPYTPEADTMQLSNLLDTSPPATRLLSPLLRVALWRAGDPNPVTFLLELEAIRQCARRWHQQVSSTDLLLSITSVQEQLRLRGGTLKATLRQRDEAGLILEGFGLDHCVAFGIAARQPDGEGPDAPPTWREPLRGRHGDPPWSQIAADIVERARAEARARRHPYAGTCHWLLAMLDTDGCLAKETLDDARMDLPSLRRDVLRCLD